MELLLWFIARRLVLGGDLCILLKSDKWRLEDREWPPGLLLLSSMYTHV